MDGLRVDVDSRIASRKLGGGCDSMTKDTLGDRNTTAAAVCVTAYHILEYVGGGKMPEYTAAAASLHGCR
jgi:hypothetical protein